MQDTVKTDSRSVTITDPIREAQAAGGTHRKARLARLNELFRSGNPPIPPLDGPYAGQVVEIDIAPLVTPAVAWLTSFWMPWKGKHLSQADARGDNIFGRGSRWLFRIIFPFYKGIHAVSPATFRAFTFNTSIAPGRVDSDRQLFKIDYDSAENPAFTIRRILDEVVQVDEGIYLGKIHFKWWWGRWKMIGYFALRHRQ